MATSIITQPAKILITDLCKHSTRELSRSLSEIDQLMLDCENEESIDKCRRDENRRNLLNSFHTSDVDDTIK